jgi:Tol biopolymer transport system component
MRERNPRHERNSGRVASFALILAVAGALALSSAMPAVAQEDDGKQGTAEQRQGTAQGFPFPTEKPEIVIGSDLEAQIQNTPYGTRFGQNKVTYDNFNFWVYKGPHFDIYYYPEEEAQLDEVVAFSEAAYDRVSSIMGHELSKRTPIIFYQTHSEFQQQHIIPQYLPEGVAAFAEPTVNRLVLPVDDPPDELLKLLTHEITHIFEYDYFYGGQVGRALRISPPGWVMEGLAEFMADDLTTLDEMMLRDITLADSIPTLVQMSYNRGFFVDYVLGQVVWNFIADQFGIEGVRIFLGEVRRDLGQDIERDIERAFNLTPSEFDDQFRDWLRDQYLPNVLQRDEADDFGLNVFGRFEEVDRPLAFSPALSPDGTKIAAISVDRKKLTLDIMTFDVTTGELIKNLTGGGKGYEYIIGQGLTVGTKSGRDVTWSPDGRYIAFFGRTGPTRTLFVLDSTSGDVVYKRKLENLDQGMSPDIGPDGRLVFAAHADGVRDIYIWDPDDDSLLNVTQDDVYDYAPEWSPDGRSIVFVSHILGHKKLFMVDLTRPQDRIQLTYGQYNEKQPSFSADGSTLYYSSDRGGVFNIYAMDLNTGEVKRYTDMLHGAFFPLELPGNQLLFSGYGDGSYELYTMELSESIEETFLATDDALSDERIAEIEADMQEAMTVELDQSNVSQSPSKGWHISNLNLAGGYASGPGNNVLAAISVEVSDLLGNHRILGVFGSYRSQRNLYGAYFNQKRRLNWGVSGTSQRLYYFSFAPIGQEQEIQADVFYSLDGGEVFASYPLSQDIRIELSAGFYDQFYQGGGFWKTTSGQFVFDIAYPSGQFVPLGASLIIDKARFQIFGPFTGRRIRIGFRASPGFSDQLQFNDLQIDWREYIQVTERNVFAIRAWVATSWGEDPTVFFMGGLNQLRGYYWLEFAGNKAWFTNFEFRFPLIDEARGGDVAIRDIRGVAFLDVGGSWFNIQENFKLWEDGAFKDAVASFGGGVYFSFFGLPLNFYLSQKTDFDSLIEGLKFDFYIGPTF